MKRYESRNYKPKEEEIQSPYIEFTINRTSKKLVGISKKEGESFRSFAYFTDSIEAAKRAILMEYKLRNVK
jgi:hypothetical protein